MTKTRIRSRLLSAAVFALTLAITAACSSQTTGIDPAYAADQHGSSFSALAGGY